MTTKRLIPTGTCWCGCQAETKIGSFFLQGHDKIATAALTAARYDNSIPALLDHHGYGPDNSVRDAAVETGQWETCPSCDYTGTPESVRTHQRKTH